jgi:hypothetical protein
MIHTGPEVSGTVDRLLADKNVKAANAFFQEQRKLRPAPDGFTEVRFRRISTNERISGVVITYIETPPRQDNLNIVIWTEKAPAKSTAGPVTIRVYAGVAEGKELTVKEDYAVADGKLDPSKGKLKEWLKCAIGNCVPAATGCALLGSGFPACFTAWCGGTALGCFLQQLLF